MVVRYRYSPSGLWWRDAPLRFWFSGLTPDSQVSRMVPASPDWVPHVEER